MYIFYLWDLPICLSPELVDLFQHSQLGSLLGVGISADNFKPNLDGRGQTRFNWGISLLVCPNYRNNDEDNSGLSTFATDKRRKSKCPSVKAFINPSLWAIFKTRFSHGYGGFFAPRVLVLKDSGQRLLIKDSSSPHWITYILKDVVLTPSELQTLILSAAGQLFDLIGRVRIHANLIIKKNGSLLTFWGLSGTGKSTRAFEASKYGLNVLTDECYWVSDSEKKIWPLNLPIKLKHKPSKNSNSNGDLQSVVLIPLGQSLHSPIELKEINFTGFHLPYRGRNPLLKVLNRFPRVSFCIQVSLGLGHPQMREIVLRHPYLFFLPKIFYNRLRTVLWLYKINLFNRI